MVSSTAKDAIYVLGGLAVVVFFIVRQRRGDRFRERSLLFPIALGIYGVVLLTDTSKHVPLNVASVVLLILSAVASIGFGVLRGRTIELLVRGGELWERASWTTIGAGWGGLLVTRIALIGAASAIGAKLAGHPHPSRSCWRSRLVRRCSSNDSVRARRNTHCSLSRKAAELSSPANIAEGVVIRPERDADHAVIAEVVRAAFVEHPDEVAAFVDRIRASEQFIPELALVAEDSSGVIAHVMLSWVAVSKADRARESSISHRCRSSTTVSASVWGRG